MYITGGRGRGKVGAYLYFPLKREWSRPIETRAEGISMQIRKMEGGKEKKRTDPLPPLCKRNRRISRGKWVHSMIFTPTAGSYGENRRLHSHRQLKKKGVTGDGGGDKGENLLSQKNILEKGGGGRWRQ